MRHSVRDSKGRFAKAQQAIREPERKDESLLNTFLQGVAVLLLTFIAACAFTSLLLLVTP